jgi:hypothetical protein
MYPFLRLPFFYEKKIIPFNVMKKFILNIILCWSDSNTQ